MNKTILTQMKSMEEYKVNLFPSTHIDARTHTHTHIHIHTHTHTHTHTPIQWSYPHIIYISDGNSFDPIQLGTVNADLIEATHTSVGGQIQKLNFTLLEAAMDMGCRVGVSI